MPAPLSLDADLLARLYSVFVQSGGVNTDTRSLQPGQLFVALRGPSFNGNRFAAQALQKGALAVVADEDLPDAPDPTRVIRVPNALQALQALARHHRRQWAGSAKPVVAITGSNGKTTTKELLRSILQQRYPAYATEGNLNNHIGVPLTLLRLKPEHQAAVVEMGDNKPGDIAELCVIAEPTHGLITNIGLDHIGGFADLADNARTKCELFDYLKRTRGHILLNLADEWLAPYDGAPAPMLTFGTAQARVHATLTARSLHGTHFNLHCADWPAPLACQSPMYGAYNLPNFAAAATAALALGCTPQHIQAGIASYKPANNRSQVVRVGSIAVVLDAYNANPSSMAPALRDFCALPGRKTVILGDMLELGGHAVAEHQAVGQLLNNYPMVRAVLVGPMMHDAFTAITHSNKLFLPDTDAAVAQAPTLVRDTDLLLLKGSRGMALEKIVKALPV